MDTTIHATPLGDVLSVDGQRFLFPAPMRTAAASSAVFGSAARPKPGTQESFIGLDLSAIPAGDNITGIVLTLTDTGNTAGPGPRGATAAQRLADTPLVAEYVDLGAGLDVGDVAAVKPGLPAGEVRVTDAGTGKRIVLSLGAPPRDAARLAVRLSMPGTGLSAGEAVKVAYNGGAHDSVALPGAVVTHEPAAAVVEEPEGDAQTMLIAQLLEMIADLRAELAALRNR